MWVRLPPWAQNMTEICPNALPDGRGGFRCKIIDQAHELGLTVFDLESVTSPINLHTKGVGKQTRCFYPKDYLQRKCFGFSVNSNGLNEWIKLAQDKKRQVCLPGNETEAASIFGSKSIALIKAAIDRAFSGR